MNFSKAICDGLGIIPGFKKVTMFKQIQEYIYTYSYNKNITPVIILDEAQFLKKAILDDLRIILNSNMDSKDYAVLLLVGQTAFINQLQRQNHDTLRQRIVINYYLNGLSREEVKEYITSRLAFAGCHVISFPCNYSTSGFESESLVKSSTIKAFIVSPSFTLKAAPAPFTMSKSPLI
jgi:type II secretory pathway predicted ATPase ExeA